MKGALPDKWIDGVAATDRPSDVAVRTLESRLGAVVRFLPLAAKKAEKDVEHIHRLRIWTRRATAALNLFEDQLPRRRFSWMKKQLKRIRRAANTARNSDVLIARLSDKQAQRGAERWLEAVRAERADSQQEVVAVHKRLKRGGRFERRIDKLLRRAQSLGKDRAEDSPVCFGDWACERLRGLVDEFFAAVPSDKTDGAALHAFRIRGKELRYAIEIVAEAFSSELKDEIYPLVEEVQHRLGEINDRATASDWLEKKIAAASNAKAAESWSRLLTKEQAAFRRLRAEYWKWCTPKLLGELRHGFDAILEGQRDRA